MYTIVSSTLKQTLRPSCLSCLYLNTNSHITSKQNVFTGRSDLRFKTPVSKTTWRLSSREMRTFTIKAKDLVELSPSTLQPYMRLMRLDRPIGNTRFSLLCFVLLCQVKGVGQANICIPVLY